jgi:hypothetical protein
MPAFPIIFDICPMEKKQSLFYTNFSKLIFDNDVQKLHFLLYQFDTIKNIAAAVEIFNYNTLSKTREFYKVEQVLRQPRLKPFQFIQFLN